MPSGLGRLESPTIEEADIFPRTFGTVAMVVGAIWIVQGAGILPTGSFMDRRPAWAVAGGVLAVIGAISFFLQRRKSKAGGPGQPGS